MTLMSDTPAAVTPLTLTDKLFVVQNGDIVRHASIGDIGDVIAGGGGGSGPEQRAARYWRIHNISNVSGHTTDGIGFSDIQFKDSSGTNLCVGGTPLASVTDGAWNLNEAFVGHQVAGHHGWYAGAMNTQAWVGYDFGTPVTPTHVDLTCLDTFPWSFQAQNGIEFSDDGSVWQSVAVLDMPVPTSQVAVEFTIPPLGANDTSAQSIAKLQPWASSGLGVHGDSITDGYEATVKWGAIAAGLLGTALGYNNGLGGRAMGDNTDLFTSSSLSGTGILIVFLGTNDYGNGSGTALGARGDAANAGTFYGNVLKVITAILTAKPNIRLGFMTPIYRGDKSGVNTAGFTLAQYVQAIIEVCGDYGIPVLDLFHRSGINSLNQDSYLNSDHLHPIDFGQQSIGRQAAAFARLL